MSEGWVKLHRQLLDSDIADDPFVLAVFIRLLLKASHKQTTVMFRHKECHLEPGQLMVTVRSLAERLGVKKNRIERAFLALKTPDTIRTESRTHGLLVTICNWEKYQDVDENDRTPEKENTGQKPDTEQECKEIQEYTPSVSPSKSNGKTRGTRLPSDWRPSPEFGAFAKEQGLTKPEFLEQVASFRDYWIAQPGQKGVKVDWLATWRNWIRRSVTRSPVIAQKMNERQQTGYKRRIL